jgi:hypothetical protein
MPALLAGTFTKTPAYLQVMRHGTVAFYAEDNTPCWTDPNGRVIVNNMRDAETLLRAHNYVKGPEIPSPEGVVAFWRHTVLPVASAGMTKLLDPAEEVDESGLLRARIMELEIERDALKAQIGVAVRDHQGAWQLAQQEVAALKDQLRAALAANQNRHAQGKGARR